MAEIRTVTTLRSKRDEILRSLKLYERQAEQARADLSHINAIIRLFEATGDPKELGAYVDVHRLFGRKEKWELCRAALTAQGDLSTKELAAHIMALKGFDVADKVLAKAIGIQLVHAMRMQASRGRVTMIGKRLGVCVWRLVDKV
jgi:hypothetical protein